jgi:hypothetical protein
MKLRLVLTLLVLVCISSAQKPKPPFTATATSHQVTLSCTASTSSGVTGYNFYRGTTAGGEAAAPLNSSPVTACGYADTNVTALTQYFYVAKAYCPTCSPNLSVSSNEVNVTVPGDPQPLPPTMNTPTAQ